MLTKCCTWCAPAHTHTLLGVKQNASQSKSLKDATHASIPGVPETNPAKATGQVSRLPPSGGSRAGASLGFKEMSFQDRKTRLLSLSSSTAEFERVRWQWWSQVTHAEACRALASASRSVFSPGLQHGPPPLHTLPPKRSPHSSH